MPAQAGIRQAPRRRIPARSKSPAGLRRGDGEGAILRAMDEAAARATLLVRAYERTPSPHWSDADRDWATQAAAHIVGEGASDDAFLARRAALAIERLRERDPAVARLLAAVRWRPWIGRVLAAAAFAFGLAVDAIGAQGRVNLLAPPLLGLLAWNLVVYLLIVTRGFARLLQLSRPALNPLAAVVARAAHALADPALRLGAAAGGAFLSDWTQASRRLTAARAGRVLHVAAIAFALGTLASLYLRGIAFEYRAGWESTFLDAPQVHALLAAVLGPASRLTGIALPDASALAALRFPGSSGAIAAPWLHLYAATIALVVLLPRLTLALVDRWIEVRWTRKFRLPLDDGYYRRLTRTLRAANERVRVLPYSVQLSAQAALGLNAILVKALGAKTVVDIAPTTPFGDEDRIDARQLAQPAPDVTVAAPLFALTATPEPENHGAFVARVRDILAPGTRLVALIDASAFARQFGAASARATERRDAWCRMLDALGCPAVIADLEQPDVAAAGLQLSAALDARTTEAA